MFETSFLTAIIGPSNCAKYIFNMLLALNRTVGIYFNYSNQPYRNSIKLTNCCNNSFDQQVVDFYEPNFVGPKYLYENMCVNQ